MPVSNKLLLATVSLSAVMSASGAMAQTAAESADQQPARQVSDSVGSSGALPDVVVTARRKSERLQDAPVSVTALSGAVLENVPQLNNIQQLVPNFNLTPLPSSVSTATVFIRGIGNSESSLVSEQGVGIYLNGVYLARSSASLFELVDMDRIEVLRGPQGTLFGRNSVGGAVQLISKAPSDEFAVDAKVGYGSDNERLGKIRINSGNVGPITASLSYMRKQRDGYVDNLLTPSSKDPGFLKSDSIFFNSHGDFGVLQADYSFDYDKRKGAASYSQLITGTPDVLNYFGQSEAFGGAPFIYGPGRRDEGLQSQFVDTKGRLRSDSRSENQGHGLVLTFEPSDYVTLKSITGYRQFKQDAIASLSGNGVLKGIVLDPLTFAPSVETVVPFDNVGISRQNQFSQELQALGTVGEVSYVAGAYYFHEHARERQIQALTFVLPGGGAGFNLNPIQAYDGSTTSYAAFGQLTWKPGAFQDRLELTGGLRYTSDHKKLEIAGDVQPVINGKTSDDNLSWLGSASYHFSRDVMGYVRVSTGYRSGGINPRASFINPFDPEKVLTYEAGTKTELFDRRLRVNLSAFYTDYSDLQIQQFVSGTGGTSTQTVNAGKAIYKGLEAEVVAIPVPGLQLEGSVGYIDPEFDRFEYLDPLSGSVINVADEAHAQNIAKVSAHAGLQYTTPVPWGQIIGRLDYSYRSSVWFATLERVNQFASDVRSRADHNLNARLTLADVPVGRSTAEFSLWGTNLTDDENIDFGLDWGALGFATATYKRPRAVGVEASFHF